MHASLLTAWLTVALAASGPTNANNSGEERACGEMQDICGWLNRGHKLPGPAPTGYAYPHTACEDCMIGDDYYPGEYCHGPCNPPSDLAFREAILMGQEDVTTLLLSAPRMMQFVRINFVRESIQITDCGGTVIANIPIAEVYGTSARVTELGLPPIRNGSTARVAYGLVTLNVVRAVLKPWLA